MLTAPSFIQPDYDQAGQLIYPVDNGEPLSNDTEHLNWINFLKYGFEDWFADREDIFVASDLLWYPEEGKITICKAPDVMLVIGRPPGARRSYLQWNEGGIAPQVVFEMMSHSNTQDDMLEKLDFYTRHGCNEFYIYNYERGTFRAYMRDDAHLISVPPTDGAWTSPTLGMTFGLTKKSLWVRQPDGTLMRDHKETVALAKHNARRATDEAARADEEAAKAAKFAAMLRQLGIDPDAVS